MNKLLTDLEVRAVQAEFQMCHTYKDKLRVYDTHFGILAEKFPEFDPKLEMFYLQEKVSQLGELFEKERRHSLPLEKIFMLESSVVTFNITPMNTNPEVFNDFIIEKFIEKDSAFNQIQKKADNNFSREAIRAVQLKAEAIKKIRTIELKLNENAESSLRFKFMTVFYQGYSDHCQNNFRKFSKRKKIIELFLYSHGILYGRYIDLLGNSIRPVDIGAEMEIKGNLSERIDLLHETGVLDFLQQKYNSTDYAKNNQLIVGILSRLLGVSLDQVQMAIKGLV